MFKSSRLALGFALHFGLLFGLSLTALHAASVTLAWDPNTEPDIAGYRLYYGSPVGSFASIVDVGNMTNTTVSDLQPALTYAFYVTCYNTSGLESEPSNVVQYTVPTTGTGNHIPMAQDQTLIASEGQDLTITLSGFDADGDALSFNLSSFPVLGDIIDYVVGDLTTATVVYRPPSAFSGLEQFTFNVSDGYDTSPDATVTIQVQSENPIDNSAFHLAIEAESAVLTAPMQAVTEPEASTTEAILTPTSNQGSATITFSVPEEADYVVWCRVKTPSGADDSFFVTLDGDASTRDIYDASQEQFSDVWHWTPLSGRGGPDRPYTDAYTLLPRVFHLLPGTHSLTFEGRENNTAMDVLLITSDLTFDAAAAAEGRITAAGLSESGGFHLEWPAFPGKHYRVLYKHDLAQPDWTVLAEDITATTSRVSFEDPAETSAARYYRIEELPAAFVVPSEPLRL